MTSKMGTSSTGMSDYGFACVPALKQYLKTAEASAVDYRPDCEAQFDQATKGILFLFA